MLPFQNPVFGPLRHLIPVPDDQPDLNIGQKISDLVIDKKIAADQKLLLKPDSGVLPEWQEKLVTGLMQKAQIPDDQAQEIGQQVTAEIYSQIIQKIDGDAVKAWGRRMFFRASASTRRM